MRHRRDNWSFATHKSWQRRRIIASLANRISSIRESEELGMPFPALWAGTLVRDYILSSIHAGATMPCTLRFYRIPVHLHVYVSIDRRSNVSHWGYGRSGIEKKVPRTSGYIVRVATISRIISLVLRSGTSLVCCWFYRVYAMRNISICLSFSFSLSLPLFPLAHRSVALKDLLLISKFLFLRRNARATWKSLRFFLSIRRLSTGLYNRV